MKKLFPYILIITIIVQLLAPFNISGSIKDNFSIKSNTVEAAATTADEETDAKVENILPTCGFFGGDSIGGCISRILYWGVFRPTSYLFALTGKLLDVSIAYSVDDDSYKSDFVVEGWKVMRDFCNMFFIFVLIYIAFATILDLNGAKTKEMIINVVIIGLLMNFSLFATQVIIDASNIITRIFYNQDTMVVGPKSDDGTVTQDLGSRGEIKISEAIVSAVNPQKLLLNAQRVSINTTKTGAVTNGTVSTGTAILTVILSSIINIVGLITFLMSSLIFISRVVGLWLAMVLAPIAFFSYTVPALQNIEMVGWKKWWPDTLKLAFLSPVFVFFLYIIVKFLGTNFMGSFEGESGLNFVLGIMVPFIFIMILLMKAKDIAKKMSGTIGESITNVVKKVGGAALGVAGGVALGGAAMAGRGLVGRGGSAIAQSGTLKAAEAKGGAIGWGAKQLRNISGIAGKGSFDVRATKLGSVAGGALQKETGIALGKAGGTGGYEKYAKEKIQEKRERAEQLKVGETEGLKQTLNKTEKDLQTLLGSNKADIDKIDKSIEKARENLKDAKNTGNTQDQTVYSSQLEAFKKQKKALLNGQNMTGQGVSYTDYDINGAQITTNIDTDYSTQKINNLSISELEKQQRADKQNIEAENRKRMTDYAEKITHIGKINSGPLKFGGITWLAGKENKEAAHKIRMDVKIENKQ